MIGQLTFGQLLGTLSGLTAFIAIVVASFKLGALSHRIEAAERSIMTRLDEFGARFGVFENHVALTNNARQEWSGWRSGVDGDISQLRTEMGQLGTDCRELRGHTADHETRITVLESTPLHYGSRVPGLADSRDDRK